MSPEITRKSLAYLYYLHSLNQLAGSNNILKIILPNTTVFGSILLEVLPGTL
jgi:hypothetical protein